MQRVLFDASIYVDSLRSQDQALIQKRTVVPGTVLWLSSVVLEELYAGSKRKPTRIVEKLERDFKAVGRILTPDLGDWVGAGRILAKIGAKHGFDHVGRSRLTNDTLIAVSAARFGIRVLTANAKDYARIAEFRQFQWEILR